MFITVVVKLNDDPIYSVDDPIHIVMMVIITAVAYHSVHSKSVPTALVNNYNSVLL